MLRQHPTRKTYSAEIKHRTFGRIHIGLKTKVRSVAVTREGALQLLLDTGEPVRDIVAALRAKKLTIEAVTECVRTKQPFETLRPSTWPALGTAIEQYIEALEAREGKGASTARVSESSLQAALDHFGANRMLESITYDDVTEFKKYLKDERKLMQNTVSGYMIRFGALYRFLQRRETRRAQQQKRPPAVLFSPLDRDEHVPPTARTRVRFLLEPEADGLFSVTPPTLKLAIALGIFAGLRGGEVVWLRPQFDIDLERESLIIQARDGWHPKYRRNREVPISSALMPYLEAHLATLPSDAPYLFRGRDRNAPMSDETLYRAIRQIVTDAKLTPGRTAADGITFHTLRHTFASWLVMDGADLFTIARLMGHRDTKQVEQTYGHLSPGHRMATVERLFTRWATWAEREKTHTETL